MRLLRPLPVLLALVPLAGCSDLGDMRGTAPFVAASGPATLAVEVGADRALARLPAEAGAVVSVTERREKDRLTQTIALSGDGVTPGTNRVSVVAASRDPERSRRVTAETIAAELEAEVPEADMRPVPQMIAGSGAPIGLATGRTANGGTCIYAWQESDVRPNGGRGGIFADERVDLSVRVRLCRRDLSEDRAIALVEGLRLRGDVVPLDGRVGRVASGVDALASAGYGSPSSSAARNPMIEAPVVDRPARSTVRAVASPVAAKPVAHEASPGRAVPMPGSAAPSPVVATPVGRPVAASGPTPSAAPAIPLPAGG